MPRPYPGKGGLYCTAVLADDRDVAQSCATATVEGIMKRSLTAFGQYSRVAETISADIIRGYSSSFFLASCLLREPVRSNVRNLYGLVRIADEIVDGAAADAGLSSSDVLRALDQYEEHTLRAARDGFSTDPVIQAFANTVRWAEIDHELIHDFFHSMRLDVRSADEDGPVTYDSAEAADYIHGSAGVIGLMCNAIFSKVSALNGEPLTAQQRRQSQEAAYALGSAFQKINFLRDYHHDSAQLSRIYLPQLIAAGLTESAKESIILEIRAELRKARKGMMLLPRQAHSGVLLAHNLFAELTDKLDKTPAATVAQQRIRLSNRRKLRIAAQTARRVTGQRFPLSKSPKESSNHRGRPFL